MAWCFLFDNDGEETALVATAKGFTHPGPTGQENELDRDEYEALGRTRTWVKIASCREPTAAEIVRSVIVLTVIVAGCLLIWAGVVVGIIKIIEVVDHRFL